jgi:hypothetical protein
MLRLSRLPLALSAQLCARLPAPRLISSAARTARPLLPSHAASAASATGTFAARRGMAAVPPPPPHTTPLFDTHKLVSTLKDAGFNESQAISIMNALVKAMHDMSAVNQTTQASKAEFTALQSEMSEKIFNLTLKFDMQSKHIREMNQKDFLSLKNDVALLQKTTQTDISALKTELVRPCRRRPRRTFLYSASPPSHVFLFAKY